MNSFMQLLPLLLLIIILVFLKSIFTKKTKTEKRKEYGSIDMLPYKNKYILTNNEYQFYKQFKIIADKDNLIICPKVGLKDLFEVTDKPNYMSWFRKISQKHIDFLICDDKLRPKYVIELDDNSHKNTIESDNFKNALFNNSSLHLIRIKAQMEYTEEYILRNLNSTWLEEPLFYENNKSAGQDESWIYADNKRDEPEESWVYEDNIKDNMSKKESIWNKKIF